METPANPIIERVGTGSQDQSPGAVLPARPLVELQNVSISYPEPSGRRLVVSNDLNLSLNRGEMAYLIGPTGSGKSSILKLLYMDLKPMSGLVRVGTYQSDKVRGKDIPHLRRMLGIVFQDFQLLPDRSAAENVAFALYATGKSGSVVKERTQDRKSVV